MPFSEATRDNAGHRASNIIRIESVSAFRGKSAHVYLRSASVRSSRLTGRIQCGLAWAFAFHRAFSYDGA